MKLFVVLLTGFLLSSMMAAQNTQQCLIVRQAEGHRFRNSMIAGALTGGIGFAAGAASGGAKYEYVDSVNLPQTKMKYKGHDLEDLQKQGVHIVTVNKKATGEELKIAHDSCFQTTPAPAAPKQGDVSSH